MKIVTMGNTLGAVRLTLGHGLPTRINFIVGTNSSDADAVSLERKKIDLAVSLGVHTITDLTMVRLKEPLWQYVKRCYPHIGVGMNPPYLPYVENSTRVPPSKLFREIEWFVMEGGDHMTMNFVPRTRTDLEEYANVRQIPITSRQGGLLAVYMRKERIDQNPYFDIMDEMLDLLAQYNVTVNIGSTFRPAGISEANDRAHRWETQQQLTMHRTLERRGVQSLVEIMSHQPLHQIGPGIKRLREEYGDYVPFQVLGPVVTDIAGEDDHITAAIGAAEAARHNVGKVTTIPSREHIGFPRLDDARRGILAARIAVHAGDLARLPELMKEDAAVLERRAEYMSCDPELGQAGCDKCSYYCPIVLGQAHGSDVVGGVEARTA